MEEALASSPPQNSAGLTVLKREIETQPVELKTARLVTKSRAQKLLRKVFHEARFQTVDNPQGTPAGHQTWQLWCKGSYGRLCALVEVTAPPDVLPYAVAREALSRINCDFEVTPGGMRAVPRPKPAPEAAQAPAQATEPTLTEQGRE